MDDYVERGRAEDLFPDGTVMIDECRYCGRPVLLRPWEEPDCGVHWN